MKNKIEKDKGILLGIHQTEKSLAAQSPPTARRVFTFRVSSRANKTQVRQAIAKQYQVNPQKIHVINLPRRKLVHRGRPGWRPGFKKVLVHLRAGDNINLK